MIAFLPACAGPMIAPDSNTLSAQVLLRAEPLTGETDVAELADIDVLVLDQNMRAFLNENVDPNLARTRKLHQLLYAIITEGSFGLQYDDTTRTAQETFAARLGNCLSFTNMFVAMAREVGIEVAYQEIDVPPVWALEDDVYVVIRHVNVVVDLGAGRVREVDFNIDDFQSRYDRQTISDERALAHYYSNVGAQHLQNGDRLEALRYFRKAVASDGDFSPVWSNLGVLFSQAGNYEYAEAAYVQALRVSPQESVAMSNLGQLYRYLGKADLAEWYSERSELHRMHNPYYRYQLAHQAFLTRDYATAIGHLKYAARQKKTEDTFYFLMGLSYLQMGDETAAHRWLEKAEKVAADDGQKRNYHNKMEMLFGSR